VWAAIFPHEALASQPNTQSLVGAMKRIQAPRIPNVQVGLPAEGVFALLRADVDFCTKVATVDQAAAEQGVTPRQLTRREASWMGQVDYFGPPLKAAWGGSPEEAEEANKAREYTEQMRSTLWGE
jgi:hypothetical protein